MKGITVFLVAVVFGLTTAASAVSLTVTSDKTTYSPGETITLTISGSLVGAPAATATIVTLTYDGVLTDSVSAGPQTQLTSAGGLFPWVLGALIPTEGATTVINQIGGLSPLTVDQTSMTSQLILTAVAPGTVNVGYLADTFDFFGLPVGSAVGTSFEIVSEDCDDGLDNDGDGHIDWNGGPLGEPIDPGCADASDLSERDPTLVCDDGADNDSDGRIDFDPVTFASPGDENNPPSGSGDPGCFNPQFFTENPQCQDGINNDPGQDGLIDYDAGLSANGSADLGGPDPKCIGRPWKHNERCGLGAELALLLPPLMWLYQTRRRIV
jgi:hypothetical protein